VVFAAWHVIGTVAALDDTIRPYKDYSASVGRLVNRSGWRLESSARLLVGLQRTHQLTAEELTLSYRPKQSCINEVENATVAVRTADAAGDASVSESLSPAV
jgi:hypothetical protein